MTNKNQEKQEKLAAALRENLMKRKALTRERRQEAKNQQTKTETKTEKE